MIGCSPTRSRVVRVEQKRSLSTCLLFVADDASSGSLSFLTLFLIADPVGRRDDKDYANRKARWTSPLIAGQGAFCIFLMLLFFSFLLFFPPFSLEGLDDNFVSCSYSTQVGAIRYGFFVCNPRMWKDIYLARYLHLCGAATGVAPTGTMEDSSIERGLLVSLGGAD